MNDNLITETSTIIWNLLRVSTYYKLVELKIQFGVSHPYKHSELCETHSWRLKEPVNFIGHPGYKTWQTGQMEFTPLKYYIPTRSNFCGVCVSFFLCLAPKIVMAEHQIEAIQSPLRNKKINSLLSLHSKWYDKASLDWQSWEPQPE